MNTAGMTQTQYARHRGVGKSAVSNWKADGLLVFVEGPGGKPMVDVARTDARVNANIDPGRGRPSNAHLEAAQSQPPPPSPAALANDELATVRTGLIVAQTVEKTLKNARTAGELVLLADMESRAGDYGRLVRECFHAIVRDKSEQLAAERDPRAIVALLQTEVDVRLSDLARRIVNAPIAPPEDEAELDEAAAEPAEDDETP